MLYKTFDEALRATDGITSGLTKAEANLLYQLSEQVHRQKSGSVLEIGAYLGKSTILLAATGPVFSVDHHRGNSEHQIGQPRFRPVTLTNGEVNTYPHFQENIARAGVSDNVIALVADHRAALSVLDSSSFPISLLFVDAEHSYEETKAVIDLWIPYVKGVALFHDYCDEFPGVIRAVDDSFFGSFSYHVDTLVGFQLPTVD